MRRFDDDSALPDEIRAKLMYTMVTADDIERLALWCESNTRGRYGLRKVQPGVIGCFEDAADALSFGLHFF